MINIKLLFITLFNLKIVTRKTIDAIKHLFDIFTELEIINWKKKK